MSLEAVLVAFGLGSLIHAGLIFWAFGRPRGALRRSAEGAGQASFAAVMGRFQTAAVVLGLCGLAALLGGITQWR